MCFFNVFSCTELLELLSTNVTGITSYMCLFMFNRHQKHSNVKYVGNISRKKHRIAKHMKIKHKHILVPSQQYQDSRHLLQNSKVLKKVIGYIQIIRWSKSLCMITEAQGVLRNFWIL